MRRKITACLLSIATVLQILTIIVPNAAAWSWREEGEFQVAAYNAPIVNAGDINVDANLDDAYLSGTKIVSYPDERPYFRSDYGEVFDYARGNFTAYIAVDTKGIYIYAEIEDETIFTQTNTNCNDGDCFQIYFDWCPASVVHPSSEEMYSLHNSGNPWNYEAYKKSYASGGKQYLGWVSGDYNGVFGGSGGFNSLSAMGPNKNEKALYKTRFTDDGWACEWYVPWRDQDQRDAVANGEQFHCGIGLQANDDSDINDEVTPGVEQNVAICFDQRREIGLSYYADYSMLSDIKFSSKCEHKWNHVKSVAATCTAYGYNTYKCTLCEGEKTERIPAAHLNKVDHICTVKKKKDVICEDCGVTVQEGLTVSVSSGTIASHVYVKQDGSVAATCTETGIDILRCKYCNGAVKRKTPALGHLCVYSNKEGKYACERCDFTATFGDANGDGVITNADVLAIFRYIYDPDLHPIPSGDAADLNLDGAITNADVLALFRYIYDPELYPIERENEEFQINGVNASEYRIVYQKNNKVAPAIAEKIADAIEDKTGKRPETVSDSDPYRNGKEILLGYSERASMISAPLSELENTEYLISAEGSFLYVGGNSGDNAAMIAAANKLIAEITAAESDYIELNMTEGEKPVGTKYSVITYNDGDNNTTNTSQVAAILNQYSPDIVGMQEVQSKHISVYESLMPGYKGVYFDHDTSKYGAPIFYRKNKFLLINSGTQWLSATPDVPYSSFEESDYIRSYVYVTLKDKTTGEEIVVVNTHVDYVADANTLQIEVLLDCTERFRGKTVIFTGDFNMTNRTPGYNMMKAADLVDCGTALGINVNGHIDFCFVDSDTAIPVAYKYISDHAYSSTASDHKPVYSEILVHVK